MPPTFERGHGLTSVNPPGTVRSDRRRIAGCMVRTGRIGMLTLTVAMLAAAAPDTSQTGMNERASSGFGRADAAMSAQYRVTMDAMRKMDGFDPPDPRSGPSYQDALLASQRSWLAFRDAECLAEGYHFRGGSAQNATAANCKTTLTRTRTTQLRMLAE